MDLIETGSKIQSAYASSVSEGHAAMSAYTSDHVSVFHVPAIAADGTSSSEKLARRSAAEVSALEKINATLSVDAIQQAGDDTLILETSLSGKLPSGLGFRFPEVMIYTFQEGKIVRIVLVGSNEMFSTLAPVMKDLGYASSDWAE